MGKRICLFLLLLTLVMGLFACGKEAGSAAQRGEKPAELSAKDAAQTRERLRYEAEQISLPEDRRVDALGGLQRMGDLLIFCCEAGEQTQLCMLRSDGTDFQVLLPNARRIWQLCCDGERIYALVEVEEEGERLRSYLAELSARGETLGSVDLAPEGVPEGWTPYRVEVSGGRIYVLGNGRDAQTSLCVLEGERLLWCESCGAASLAKLPDGRVLLGQSRGRVAEVEEDTAEGRLLQQCFSSLVETDAELSSPLLQSETLGQWSRTYAASQRNRDRELGRIIREYLGETGLLYRGWPA